MTPIERYRNDLKRPDFSEDPAQRLAVQHCQSLYEKITAEYHKNRGVLSKLKHMIFDNGHERIKGLYFWGGVGRGKTYIIDCFYECLPIRHKQRIHFHRFMQMVHRELRKYKDIENPLVHVADKLTKKTRVLCFDEFHVTDITDAMLLGGLLTALFERGIILVTTSNESPDDLYAGGLQRERFLPAIELIKEHTKVLNVDSGIDYRLRYFDKAEIYHYPLDEDSADMLKRNFEHISPDWGEKNVSLDIEGRDIQTVRRADGVVWFDFDSICSGPRGAADYIELAREYQTVLIANVPRFNEDDNDKARRFMTLVDEFYDRQVKLILTAEEAPEKLYGGKRLAREFERTVSRLKEMTTHDYLAKPHLS